jgi:hypothetical protein
MFSSTVKGLSGELSIAFEPVRCQPRSARRPRQPHRFALVAAHGDCQAPGGIIPEKKQDVTAHVYLVELSRDDVSLKRRGRLAATSFT